MHTYLQLAPSFELFKDSQEQYFLYTTSERFIRLKVPTALLENLLNVFYSKQIPQALFDETSDEIEKNNLQKILESFLQQGYLQQVPVVSSNKPIIKVVGENLVAQYIRQLLTSYATSNVEKPAVLINCNDYLPDQEWLEVAATCSDLKISWQRCYYEAGKIYIGPFFVPAKTASYKDERMRRLAACAFPTELQAYWKHLENSKPSYNWEASVAMGVAGVMLSGVTDWLQSGTIKNAHYQTVWDTNQNCWEQHPILPVPQGILRSA